MLANHRPLRCHISSPSPCLRPNSSVKWCLLLSPIVSHAPCPLIISWLPDLAVARLGDQGTNRTDRQSLPRVKFTTPDFPRVWALKVIWSSGRLVGDRTSPRCVDGCECDSLPSLYKVVGLKHIWKSNVILGRVFALDVSVLSPFVLSHQCQICHVWPLVNGSLVERWQDTLAARYFSPNANPINGRRVSEDCIWVG